MNLLPAPASIRSALTALSLLLLSGSAAMAQAPAGTGGAAAAPGGGGTMELLSSFLPIVLLVIIFWFLIFRPQQKRMKAQREMLSAIRRGDTIVTSGGIVGKVTKSVEGEDLEVEIAPDTRVKIVRHMVSDVRSRSEPVADNAKS